MLSARVDDASAISSAMSSSHVCVPHTCIMYRNICLGAIGDLSEYQFVFDEDALDTHTEDTDSNEREEGHAESWTPFFSVCVYIFLL